MRKNSWMSFLGHQVARSSRLASSGGLVALPEVSADVLSRLTLFSAGFFFLL